MRRRLDRLAAKLTYPVGMEGNAVTNEIFDGMAVFGAKLTRAETRCREIAQQEDLMGYKESAKTYFDMRGEIFCARIWIQEILESRIGEVW